MRLRRSTHPIAPSQPEDIRDVFIRRVATGRSFVDVGALWGTVNEKVSVAKGAGATTMAWASP